MPCDTPPPPLSLEDDDVIEEDPDELMYEFVDESELGEFEIENDDSIVTFSGHKDSIFCCNFDKCGQYAVSGGQDDTAFVWETATGNAKFECTGHTDSVISASFSPDSKYVATADMNGLLQVWDKDDESVVWSFECSEITWMEWLHKTNILIAGTADGDCWKWSIPDGDTNILSGSGCASTAGCISFDDEKLAVGYSDGSIKFWNVDDNSVVGTVTASMAHKLTVTNIKFHQDNNLIITGSEDGTAKIIKTSNCKVIWSINCCDSQHAHEDVSVESVGFFPNNSLVIIGSNCGQLSFWDISTQIKRFNCDLEAAVVKLICAESSPTVYVGTAEGIIQAYDIRTGLVNHTWVGHKSAILDMTISMDHRHILSSSDDHTCKIFVQSFL